ncbi:MAG TPA: hypothetical protein VMQ81_00035, partial [Acidimicrobiia bacterium]|nr:hypothetical protein [Acidimicrobiia bacterium]
EGVSIGALLLLVGIVGALGAFVPQLRLLMVVAGAAAIVVVVAFVYQLGEFADLVNEDAFGTTGDVGRGDLIGFGVWVAALAGVALLVAGLLSGRAQTRALPSKPDRADERSP